MNIIYQEFNLKITGSIAFVNQAKEYSKTIGQYSSDIKNTINGINSNLQPLTSTFTDLETTVISNWIDYVNILFCFLNFLKLFFLFLLKKFSKNLLIKALLMDSL